VSLPTLPLPQDGPSEMSHTLGALVCVARVRVWSRGDWAATERMTGWGQRGTREGFWRIVQQTGGGAMRQLPEMVGGR
jgi:hypothetical protein